MESKHPQADLPELAPDPTATPLCIFNDQVSKSLKTFKKGSAAGPSGLRPEHLKVATKFGSPVAEEKVVTALTKLCNVVLAGKVPADVAPYFFGARLHGALKKDGGVRPIAVGEVIQRLASKCAVSSLSQKVASYLSPFQLGVGVRGGCEAVVHAVRAFLDQDLEHLCFVQVDFINAFNLADMLLAFSEIKEHSLSSLSWSQTATELLQGWCMATPSS